MDRNPADTSAAIEFGGRPLREGVDRNGQYLVGGALCIGRPLREGVDRNQHIHIAGNDGQVALYARAWIEINGQGFSSRHNQVSPSTRGRG